MDDRDGETEARIPIAEQSGKFIKGKSGNPRGRPKGARNKATVLLDQMGHDAAAEILQVIIKTAMAGDARSAALIFQRTWPVSKGRTVSLGFGPIDIQPPPHTHCHQ